MCPKTSVLVSSWFWREEREREGESSPSSSIQFEVFLFFFFFKFLRLTRWGCHVISQMNSQPQILCGFEIFSFLLLLSFLFSFPFDILTPIGYIFHPSLSTTSTSPLSIPRLNYSPHLFLITFSFLYFFFFLFNS